MSKAEIQALLKLDRHDYYAILSSSRSSSAEEIKRSYRKLALKFHPDKNREEGADEAFKMVAKAFSVLGDEKKRAEYDRFGGIANDNGFTGGFNTAHAHSTNPFNHFHHGPGDEISPEELFNLFFGGLNAGGFGGMPGGFGGMPGGFHFQFGPGMHGFQFHQGFNGMNHRQRTRPNTTTTTDPWTELKQKLLQILPVLLFLAYSLLNTIFSSSSPSLPTPKPSSQLHQFKDWISLDYSPPLLRFERTTSKLAVPYFTSPAFERRFSSPELGKGELKAFEELVERAFIKKLQGQCRAEEGALARAEKRARDEEERVKVRQEHALPSCTRLRLINKK